jgi:hypothetical protein
MPVVGSSVTTIIGVGVRNKIGEGAVALERPVDPVEGSDSVNARTLSGDEEDAPLTTAMRVRNLASL